MKFVDTIETRSGVINIESDGTIYGNGGYDGRFSTNIVEDVNGIVRPYFLGALHPNPSRVLMIGLASGAWAQVIANHPGVKQITIVEINPGYLDPIPNFPQIASLLDNLKVKIEFDDGRRWLTHHEDESFDIIVMNTTQHWRAHVSSLLSAEFFRLAQSRLNRGGVLYLNATDSWAVHKTAISVFQHVLRVSNMIAASDYPIDIDKNRWQDLLAGYTIDGQSVFGSEDEDRLAEIVALIDDVGPATLGVADIDGHFLEFTSDIAMRTAEEVIITDDNMYTEWYRLPPGPFPNRFWRVLTPTE